MRRILHLAVALVAVLLVARGVSNLLTNEEDRIARRIEAMAAGFDGARIGPIADGIARGYRDQHAGFDRAAVLDALRALFIAHAQGPFPYRVELENVRIELGPDERTARVALRASFVDLEAARNAWSIDVEALMEPRDGWQIVSSEYTTAEGGWRGLR